MLYRNRLLHEAVARGPVWWLRLENAKMVNDDDDEDVVAVCCVHIVGNRLDRNSILVCLCKLVLARIITCRVKIVLSCYV